MPTLFVMILAWRFTAIVLSFSFFGYLITIHLDGSSWGLVGFLGLSAYAGLGMFELLERVRSKL